MTLSEPARNTPMGAPTIPSDAAQSYLSDMVRELHGIAQHARLDDIAALLHLTLTVLDASPESQLADLPEGRVAALKAQPAG